VTSLFLGERSLFLVTYQDSWELYFQFDISNPAQYFGLPIILSFFFHANFQSFLLNLVLLFVALRSCEKMWGRRRSFFLAVAMHLSVLLFLTLTQWIFLWPGLELKISGASCVSIGMLGAAIAAQRNQRLVFAGLGACVWVTVNSFTHSFTPPVFSTALVAVIAGVAASRFSGLRRVSSHS
jgi:membrane associated rhomboid family serine protease